MNDFFKESQIGSSKLGCPGTVFQTTDKKQFIIGGKVKCTDGDFQGLVGTVVAIYTGGCKETENEGADIECCFEVPEDESLVKELEETFTNLRQCETKLEEIGIDLVMMISEDLEPMD